MQDYGTLPATRNSRNSATVVITPQNSLAESAKVFLVLPLERVTGRTEAMREGHFIPAPAVHSSLNDLLHFPAPQRTGIQSAALGVGSSRQSPCPHRHTALGR